MHLTDNLYSMYIRHILLPKMEDFSTAGYVFTKLTRDSKEIMLRDVFVPEEWVSELEIKTIEKYGIEGRKLLYTIGKNGGYTYARLSGIETIMTKPDRKEFEEYLRLLLLLIAGTYGAELDYELNLEMKTVRQSYSRFVVCEKNGIGEIVIAGSATGIGAWMIQDTTMEGVQTECIGRGDRQCTVLLGPPEVIESKGYIPFRVPQLMKIDLTREYLTFNMPQPTVHARKSLEDLINYKVVEFKDGKITFHNKRYFEWDSHYIYFLEYLYNDQEMLFELTKQYYKKVGEEIVNLLKKDYISDNLCAMGWGDILIYSGPKIHVKH